MLELRKYSSAELMDLLGGADNQGLRRKLTRYGVVYQESGHGASAVFDITDIEDPFKIFCITELAFSANSDFRKVRNFYYYYFNDEEFMSMPDEVKEVRMRDNGRPVSRQTIAGYTEKLLRRDMISRNTKNFIYYFAYKQTQRIVEREEYLTAWHEYWAELAEGGCSFDAIWNMRAKYGGVARKQPIPEINGIYNKTIEYMMSLIQKSFEDELGE